jgi:hypothetical protein
VRRPRRLASAGSERGRCPADCTARFAENPFIRIVEQAASRLVGHGDADRLVAGDGVAATAGRHDFGAYLVLADAALIILASDLVLIFVIGAHTDIAKQA